MCHMTITLCNCTLSKGPSVLSNLQAQLNDVTLAEAHNYLRERLLLDMDVPRLSALERVILATFRRIGY